MKKPKIKCPTGDHKTVQECRDCPNPCLPKPIRHSLLHERDKERKTHEKPTFGVTRLTTNCLRQSYYQLTEEQVHDLEKLWIFSRGHAIHEFITKTLDDKDKEVFIRKDFPDFTILGFIDALHDGTIYEFKTTSNIPSTPQKHHALQAQAYYTLLPIEQQKQIKKLSVIYLSLGKIVSFEVPKRDILPWLIVRAQQLTNALKNNAPPEKEVTWLCNYCDFQEQCEKADKKDFSLF